MNDVKMIKELVELLNKASEAYYKYDNPIMSDKQFDDLYDKLAALENKTGIILNNSPTQNVGGEIIPELKKVQHTRPMLSSDKTKDISEIKKFVSKHPCMMSWKEDGLTVVLRYKDGKFVQAITRGSGGLIGEDVTHTMKMCSDIPMKLPYCADIQVRGECLISYKEFDRINSGLIEGYKTPRNLAAGTVRQLDSNIVRERKLTYKAFELDQEDTLSNPDMYDQIMTVEESFNYLEECGFNVVEHILVDENNVEEMIEKFNPEEYELPVDGLIFKYNDVFYGNSLGKTAKYPLDMLALKWEDEVFETKLLNIEWTMGKVGSLCPTAIFSPVEIDGTIVERASLHNVSVMKSLLGHPYVGQTIGVYKSNMIIPQLAWADKDNNYNPSREYLDIPETCPVCGTHVNIVKDKDSEVLMCENPNCSGKLLGKISHASTIHALNIVGFSDETIQKFINLGWLKSIRDIYYLKDHKQQMIVLDGLGRKSVEKLLNSIEKSRDIDLGRFINACSIPLFGYTNSKQIAKYCDDDFDIFAKKLSEKSGAFNHLEGIGEEKSRSLDKWWNEHCLACIEFAKELRFAKKEIVKSDIDLSGMSFVITGSLTKFKNRDALKEKIESLGGKVAGSVSSKTTALINNDVESSSSKNKKAKSLGIPILSEDDFIEKYLGGEIN